MATFEVSLLSRGGADSHKVRIDATSPDRAKEAALAMANARAKASGKPYEYVATNVHTV